jgi:hypothetical protein
MSEEAIYGPAMERALSLSMARQNVEAAAAFPRIGPLPTQSGPSIVKSLVPENRGMRVGYRCETASKGWPKPGEVATPSQLEIGPRLDRGIRRRE